MPDPPSVNLFTRFVLENPWPLAIALLAIAGGAAWIGLRDGRRNPLNIAGTLAGMGVIVLAIGLLITTPAEHGKRVTRDLVNAAVANDVPAAMALFSSDALFNTGSPGNPGMGLNFIRDRLDSLPRYSIRSNRITSLRGYTESADRAIVHLSCSTSVEGHAAVPSQWVVRVDRQPDGQWRISRLTAISIAGMAASERWW